MTDMEQVDFYASMLRPTFAPPAWVFSPVWTVLYILIFISFGFVFYQYSQKRLPCYVVKPFFLNLISNFAFMPLFFGLQNYWLGSIDIVIVLISLIWMIKAIYPFHKWVAYLQIPYLIWVSFATVLQLSITWLNI